MSDARERWNARHHALAAGPTTPAQWLVDHRELVERAPRGRALDVACGRGRHTFFLASLGFEVVAVDVSDVAVSAIGERARRFAANVSAVRADLERDPLPMTPYAVIVVIDYLQRSLFGALEDALVPGGVLVMETFGHADPRMRPAYKLTSGELLGAFPRLDVLDHRDSGTRAGLVARRPTADDARVAGRERQATR